jgi:uncharacterized protein (DUF2062 family)
MSGLRAQSYLMRTLPIRLRRLVYGLRTEGGGRAREAAAIGVGVFIGCSPFYGFHLILCIAVSSLLRLNRLKTYLAANISIPLVAPWLLLAELQTGALIRRGTLHQLSIAAIKTTGAVAIGMDVLIGSLVVGGALAALAAWGTFALAAREVDDVRFAELVRRASDRYVEASITAWEFARGKLRFDPIYRALVCGGLLERQNTRGTLIDIGCGQGLTLAVLSEARAYVGSGALPGDAELAVFDRLIGVELRPRVAAIAAAALRDDAEITAADARRVGMEPADAVLFLDVLQMIPPDAQEALIASAAAALTPGGVIIIREADAGGGWRFRMVALGNRLKALAFGNWGQQWYFRSVAGWETCLARFGMRVETRPMGQGTPFANVVLLITRTAAATSSTNKTDTSTAAAR